MLEIADIHIPFVKWLDERGIPFHRNRSDKRTTAAKGDPDFLLTWCSYCVYIECKVPGGKLSKDQEKRIAYLRKAGNKVAICYSLQECVEAAKGILCHGEDKNAMQAVSERQNEALRQQQRDRLIAAADAARERVSKLPQDEREELLRHSLARTKPEPNTQTPAEGQKESPSEPAPNLFIADFGNKPCVFEQLDNKPGVSNRLVRLATQYDLLNIPRR